MVKVRIAPSPTGYLHIGTARTALFNFLFAKQNNGEFLLRIEDTDIARNNEASYNSILKGLEFLGLNWNGEVIYQSKRMNEHALVAKKLVETGHAYYCYLSQEELENRRASIKGYIHKYQEGDETPRENTKPVIRMKLPRNVEIVNNDLVKGRVVINSDSIEDFVILRGDGTPVYMLSVVCDDIYMGITHVLRGDDHLTNTPKQILIYNALGAKLPLFGHIPLIHGADGAKLSKRHGALGIEEYKNMGYLPQSLRSYLVNLGWGEGETKILNDEEMVKAFSVEKISNSPSRFDFERLNNINHHFIVNLAEEEIYKALCEFNEAILHLPIESMKRAIHKIRYRFNTLVEMSSSFVSIINKSTAPEIVEGKEWLVQIVAFLKSAKNTETLENEMKAFLKEKEIPMGKIFPILRLCFMGVNSSIGIFEIIYIITLEEAIKRIELCL